MFTQRLSLTNQDARKASTTQLHVLGSVAETADGRVYRYAKVGGTNIARGLLNVNADLDSNVTNVAVTVAAAAGEQKVSFTAGGSQTADAFRDGFLTVNDADGEGVTYAVNGHTGGTALTVTLKEQLIAALTTSSEVTLKQNTWGGIVISATDQNDQPVGVSNVTIAANGYGWVQTRGECSVLADEALTRGDQLTTGTGVAGAVEVLDAVAEPLVGIASETGVDTEYRNVFLQID